MGALSWIIQMGPRCHHSVLRQKLEWHGQKPRDGGSHQKLEEARKGFSPRASRGGAALLTPWSWPRDADLQSLASRTVREYTSVDHSHQVWHDLLQQPQEIHRGTDITLSKHVLWKSWFIYEIKEKRIFSSLLKCNLHIIKCVALKCIVWWVLKST